MAQGVVRGIDRSEEFTRLHRQFVEHYAIALGLVWIATAAAAAQAPWLRNIRALIDPAARAESTASFLFSLPVLLTLGLVCLVCGADLMRRSQLLRSQTLEFALAGLAAFAVFCMALARVVTAMSLGG